MKQNKRTKNLRQTRTFSAPPREAYNAIMDSKIHSKFTSAKTKMSAKVGGKFTASDGWISGQNLELVPNKKIVQLWRGDDWPAGHYSKATFSFAPAGRGKTKLTFTQSSIPADKFEGIKQGWIEYYWEAMEAMFRSQAV